MATLNPHITIRSDPGWADFQEDMDALMEQFTGDEDAINEVFGTDPFVVEVKFGAFGYEVQPVRKSGHVHVEITIHHHVERYSVRKLDRRWRDWLNENDDVTNSKGWYVFSRIMDSRGANYATKRARQQANAEFLATHGDDPNYQRLSSDWSD